ncbi:2-C-methyl-D-erythritol 4-phosphate cytidylyltransferase [Gemmatimonadota bacterium]
MNSPPDVGVLIAAAGQGVRAGGAEPKQFRPIAGVPMLQRAIRPFFGHPRVRQVVVALPSAHVANPPKWLNPAESNGLRLVVGGATRSQSVKAALEALDPACSVVLVHDAARPFVSKATIDAVIAAAARLGVVPAVPVSDTIKRANESTRQVIETVDRRGLWRAQTPQGCPRIMLEQAYEMVGAAEFTDESALLEATGFQVELVPDLVSNFKVTTHEDFVVAEAMLGT